MSKSIIETSVLHSINTTFLLLFEKPLEDVVKSGAAKILYQ